MIGNSGPTAARTAWISSMAKRERCVDVVLGHAVHNHVAFFDFLTRAIAWDAGVRLGAQLAYIAHVPQLRNDLAAFGVHRLDHVLPTSQGVFTVETWHVRVTIGDRKST